MSSDDPSPRARRRAAGRAPRALTVVAVVLAWVVVALPVTALTFVNSDRTTVLAGHEATVRPTLDGWAVLDLGPFLPSLRYPSGSRVGAEITLGRTPLTSYEELGQRYAFIAAQPESQISKVAGLVTEMALDSLLVGSLAGLAGPAVWFALGSRRRRELVADRRRAVPTVTVLVVGLGLVAVAVLRPWDRPGPQVAASSWLPIAEALPGITVPAEARPLQMDAGLLSDGTRRLVESALDSYKVSSTFYDDAALEAADLSAQLHRPTEEQTVGVLVSDRHDNIGMDQVARAIADAGGASFLMDTGDDTSTGSSWESFSLESLDVAFEGVDERFYVAGNHDHGSFVTEQAADLGFTTLDGTVVEGPDDITLLGVDDPRSSGLGNWRDQTGLSFDEVGVRLGDEACAAEDEGRRVSTILVHDANLAQDALDRGCVDLVLAGHLHVVVPPERVVGNNDRIGYRYTTGTTGGAAYAIAIGTKPRRDATVSLVTYRDGRPVGLQWVSLSPLGDFTVGDYTPLPRPQAIQSESVE